MRSRREVSTEPYTDRATRLADAPINARTAGEYGAGQGRKAPSAARAALTRAIAPAQSRFGASASALAISTIWNERESVRLRPMTSHGSWASRRCPAARIATLLSNSAVGWLRAARRMHVVLTRTSNVPPTTTFENGRYYSLDQETSRADRRCVEFPEPGQANRNVETAVPIRVVAGAKPAVRAALDRSGVTCPQAELCRRR